MISEDAWSQDNGVYQPQGQYCTTFDALNAYLVSSLPFIPGLVIQSFHHLFSRVVSHLQRDYTATEISTTCHTFEVR